MFASHPYATHLQCIINSMLSYDESHVPEWLVQEYKRVDEELFKLFYTRSAVRTRRNMLAFISRMPPEILSQIFECCVNDTRRYISGIPDNYWFKFSHVCQHWRHVALNNPGLWNHITFHQPRWTKEMLQRSRNYPLMVEITAPYYKPSVINVVHDTLQQSHRIRLLRFAVQSDLIMARHLSTMKTPMHVLQSLTLAIGTHAS